MDEPGDNALIEKALRGDESSLVRLYERWADPVFGYVVNQLSGSPEDAEEIFQETWLAVWEAIPSFRGESGFYSWLCGIARRKIADHLRRKSRKRALFAASPDGHAMKESTDTQPQPDEHLGLMEKRGRVLNALGSLPPDYRMALFNRYVEGESVEQLSRKLEKTYKATESLLSRARESLKNALEKENRHE